MTGLLKPFPHHKDKLYVCVHACVCVFMCVHVRVCMGRSTRMCRCGGQRSMLGVLYTVLLLSWVRIFSWTRTSPVWTVHPRVLLSPPPQCWFCRHHCPQFSEMFVCVCWVCVPECMFTHHICSHDLRRPEECHISWNWSYGWLWVACGCWELNQSPLQ